MGTWTVDDEAFVATVAAEPGRLVDLTLGKTLGDSQVTVTVGLTVKQVEELRRLLAVAVGIAQGTPQ